MITLSDLSLGYGPRTLLAGITATVPAANLCALIGRNGSGKSTLLRAIAGINRSYEGSIAIDGHDIRTTTPVALAKLLAFVNTERVRIANLRCADVVALGRAPYTDWIGKLRADDRRAVADALEAVGMSAYADRTMDRMSDGECQRVMIARAIAQDTPAMLLDEPTSFLDMPNRRELCSLLAELAHERGKTIIFSTHELDLAMDCADTIMLVDNPSLIVRTPAEMEREGHIERLFNTSRWTTKI